MCFVYGLWSPIYQSGATKYIGVTNNPRKRLNEHKREARLENPKPTHKTLGIRKVWKLGGEIEMHLFHELDSTEEAKQVEIEYIALVGRENLWNGTDGGDGGTGRIWTMPDEVKDKISKAHKGMKVSEQVKLQMSITTSTLWEREDYRQQHIDCCSTYWDGFISPDGTEYRDIFNLAAFSREHNLDNGKMIKVYYGERNHHQGWRRVDVPPEIVQLKLPFTGYMYMTPWRYRKPKIEPEMIIVKRGDIAETCTGKICKRGHVNEFGGTTRYKLSRACVECKAGDSSLGRYIRKETKLCD